MRVVDAWHTKTKKRTARYGKGKRWVATWRQVPGQPEWKRSFTYKDAAEKFIADRIAGLPLPEEVAAAEAAAAAAAIPPPTFGQYWEKWLPRQVHLDERSRRVYGAIARGALLGTLKDTPLPDIDRATVQDLIANLSKTREAATVRQDYTLLHSILTDAMVAGVIDTDPCVRIRLPKAAHEHIVPLSVEQVQEIVDAMGEPFSSIAVLVAATGLRSAEFRGLTADRVDLAGQAVRVDRQQASQQQGVCRFKTPKTPASNRRVRIGPKTVDVLRPYVEAPGFEGLVFSADEKRILTQALVQKEWDRVAKTRAWMGEGWHQLRHHHVSQLVAAGASPVAVAHRLGHKDATVTLRTYAHFWPDDDAKLAAASDGLVKLDHHQITTDATGNEPDRRAEAGGNGQTAA